MQRVAWCLAAALGGATLLPSSSAADPTQAGAYLGPRVYSDDSRLGLIEDAPAHPAIENTIQVGLRIARPLFPWLVPEIELSGALSDTTAVGGAAGVDVYWLEPRLHARFELWPHRRFMPFMVLGVGFPVVISEARMTLDSGIQYEGYIGFGMRYDTGYGFVLRGDARVSAIPGIVYYFTPEADVTIGVELALGKRPKPPGPKPIDPGTLDVDRDGIVASKDACPDRAEDADGFDDLDGCPDIDNDADRVLDIADRCATVPETYNGFDDQDGCPDTVPADVAALPGTIEGLLYAEGETVVRASAQASIDRIAKLMGTHPSIKLLVVGHSDDREANQFAEPGPSGQTGDTSGLAVDLSIARAEAVRQALVTAGVAAGRIQIDGRGFEESVADNATPKGRLANRRVEVKLFVPPN